VAHVVRELWAARELVQQLVTRDIRVRYHQAFMGFAWALLMPMLIVLSGTIVRLAMSTMSGSALEAQSIGATAVKGLAWAFFAGALGTATQSLHVNSALIGKLYFPRESLPLSTIIAQSFDTIIGAAVVALLVPFLGLQLSWALLWVPILAALIFVLVTALSLLTSCANLFFRDVKYIVQVLLTFGIFLTPVFFEPVMLGPVVGKLMMLNPVSPLIEALRLTVFEGRSLLQPIVETTATGVSMLTWSPWYLVYSTAFALVGLVASIRIFRRAAVLFAEFA
jgi:ABC-type polysaccharide/polyol phosphate export permease